MWNACGTGAGLGTHDFKTKEGRIYLAKERGFEAHLVGNIGAKGLRLTLYQDTNPGKGCGGLPSAEWHRTNN